MIQNLKLFFLTTAITALFSTIVVATPLAVFNYKVFYVPETGPVIETYFDISGESVTLAKNEDGYLTAKVEIVLVFKKDDKIVTFDKKIIESPQMSPQNIVDFIDIDRFAIPSGNYQLEINISDSNDSNAETQTTIIDISIPTPPSGIFVSDIQLISAFKKTTEPGKFTKSGYDMIPMVDDSDLRAGMHEVVCYAEIYGVTPEAAGEMFLVRTYLAKAENNEIVPTTVVNQRRNAAEVVPVVARMAIADVEAGNYNMVIDVISKENEKLASKKLPITRSVPEKSFDIESVSKNDIAKSWINKYDQKAVLFDYFHSLRPISNRTEAFAMDNSLRRLEDVELSYLQRYFYGFWESRNPENSEEAWLEYKAKVDLVEKEFGTRNKRGYETDQGRIYLKYGAPNQMVDRANEPSSYPYIIWQYYKAGNYNNVKFVFYDPTLLRQDYQLIHSENIPGEIMNYRWQMLLNVRDTPFNNIDRTQPDVHYGGRADDYFNNPR